MSTVKSSQAVKFQSGLFLALERTFLQVFGDIFSTKPQMTRFTTFWEENQKPWWRRKNYNFE